MVCRIDGAGLPAHHHRVAPSNADRPEICPRAGETGTSRQNRVDNRLLYKLFPPLLLFFFFFFDLPIRSQVLVNYENR